MKNLILFLLLSSVHYSARAMEQENNFEKRMIPIEYKHPNIAKWESEFKNNVLKTDKLLYFIPDILDFMMTRAEKDEYFRILNLGVDLAEQGLEDEEEQCCIKTYNIALNAWIKFKSYNPGVEWKTKKSSELSSVLQQYLKMIGE